MSQQQEMSAELLTELKKHKDSTKKLVAALFQAGLLLEEDLLDPLRDSINEKKPSLIFKACVNQLYRLGKTPRQIYGALREHKVPNLEHGLIPGNDPDQFQGLAIIVNYAGRLHPQRYRSDVQMSEPIDVPAGSKGRIDFSILPPFHLDEMSVLSRVDVPLVLQIAGQDYQLEARWRDIEIDLDAPTS